MARKFKDFVVTERKYAEDGELRTRYEVGCGGCIHTVSYNKEHAQSVCDELNEDHLAFERKYWNQYKAKQSLSGKKEDFSEVVLCT